MRILSICSETILIHSWYTMSHEIKFNYPQGKKFRYNHSLSVNSSSAFGLSLEFNTFYSKVGCTHQMLTIFRVFVLSQAIQIPGVVSGERIKTELEFLQADLLHRNI